MKLKYINKIKANMSIVSSKKTTNLLEGTYKSVYIGKSMNFENLREYVINDEIKDIDWKSSARSGKLLVKQFVALRKHNIMFVMDRSTSMNANTDSLELKKDIALYSAGTLGYLAIKNGDYVGMLSYENKKVSYKPFKTRLYDLEEYLSDYDNYQFDDSFNLNNNLNYLLRNIKKRMIIFIITDINGIDNLDINLLKSLMEIHDIMIININDNNMYGDNLYDIDNNSYIPKLFLNDKKLLEEEKNIKKNIIDNINNELKKNKISMTSISSKKEINEKIIRLLEEHRYASNN